MNAFLPILIVVALAAVAIVLVLGLFTLVRKTPDGARSNRLMQWRVALQGVALIVILLAVLLARVH